MTDIWNQVSDTWNETTLIWKFTPEIYSRGGKSSEDYLNWLVDKKKPSVQTENFIKIFITVHNQFLTEKQKQFFRIAKAYPTYEEEFEIKKQEKVFLKEYKLKEGIDLTSVVRVRDIKIGLNKIEKNVKNNPK